MKDRCGFDLLAKVWRCVEENPARPIGRYGKRRLARRPRRRIAGAGATARLVIGVPLRKTATRRRSQHANPERHGLKAAAMPPHADLSAGGPARAAAIEDGQKIRVPPGNRR